MFRRIGLVLALAASLSTHALAAERLFLLERGPKDIVVANPATGAVIQKIQLPVEPEQMFATPDGRRVVVLNRVSKAPASITIVDTASAKVLGTVEVGWGVPDESTGVAATALGLFPENHRWGSAGTILLEDGKQLLVVSPGDKSHPSELVIVDLEQAAIAGRVPSPIRATRFLGTATITSSVLTNRSDNRLAVVFNPPWQQKKESAPAEIAFVDLATPKVLGTMQLDGNPSEISWPRGSEFIYALQPAEGPNASGRLHWIMTADRSIKKSLAVAGATALSMTADNDLFLLGPAAVVRPDQSPARGEIRAVRGETVGDPISVLARPLAVVSAPDRGRLTVICEQGISVIDRESQKVVGDIILAGQLSDFVFIDGGKRGLALLYDTGSQTGSLAILDLTRAERQAAIQAGSKGKAFLLSVLGGIAAGQMGAIANPMDMRFGRVMAETRFLSQWASSQSADLVVSPDDRRAYVLNTATQDVTIVDLEGRKIERKMGAASGSIYRLNNLLLLPWDSGFNVVDMRSGKELPRGFTMSGVYVSPVLSPSGALFGVMFTNVVFVIDGATGSQLAKVSGKRLAGALFLPEFAQ